MRSICLLSDLHYKLIMNEKPQKKGRTQVLDGSSGSCPSLLPQGSVEPCMLTQRGPVLDPWTDAPLPSHCWPACCQCPRHEVCAVGAVGRLHTLPLLSPTKIGVALWQPPSTGSHYPGRLMVLWFLPLAPQPCTTELMFLHLAHSIWGLLLATLITATLGT